MKRKVLNQFLVFTIYFVSIFKLNSVHGYEEEVVANVNASTLSSDNISSQGNGANQPANNEGSNLVNGDLEPSVDVQTGYGSLDNEHLENLNTPVFSDVLSQNSGVANEIINNDTPVVLPLSDSATAELQNRANIPPIQSENKVESHFTNVSQDIIAADITNDIPVENTTTQTLEEKSGRSDLNLSNSQTDKIVIEVPIVPKNLTDTNSEEIPSFSEWAQKQLEEVEKKEQVNSSIQNQNITGKQGSKRWKNYASLDCGAKVVMANPEAGSPWAILSPSKDEYKLNTCTSRIWFIVELCESIQVKKIDLANYELFSSSPKDFTVWVSDRFPTRDWSLVGHFTAKDERNVQSFDVNHQIFGKYIKVEIKSHYGSEHYCPLSLFRAYGTSVFEVLQKEDPAHVHRAEEDDDDDDETLDVEAGNMPKNILSSATDAVISMVKKAAEALGNKVHSNNQTQSALNSTMVNSPLMASCSSPSHYVVCNNCSDLLFGKIYELLSCRAAQITNLVSIPFIKKALLYSTICHTFGFDFKDRNSEKTLNACPDCIRSFFPVRYLGALCNSLAILQNKVVLNTSTEYSNTTDENMTVEKAVNINTSQDNIIETDLTKVEVQGENIEDDTEIPVSTAPLTVLDPLESIPKASCSTDLTYASQIKPTKSLPTEVKLNKSSVPEVNTKTVIEGTVVNEEPVESIKTEPVTIAESTGDTSQEVLKEPDPVVTESIETVDEPLDNFISEFNGDGNQNTAGSASTTSTLQAQKESVFLRLSNRIKTLERNMSLSSQYLEELSKRYKKQVEEMQRLLEKTVFALHEESKRKDERNKHLEERLDSLTAAVENLVAERNSWKNTFCWFLPISAFGSVIYCTLFCRGPTCAKHSTSDPHKTVEVQRRQSIDVVNHKKPQKKKRRPSDQALKVVASSTLNPESERKEKLRKKRKKALIRSDSINTLNEEQNNFEPKVTSSKYFGEGKQGIQELSPFVLDESEHTTLEALPTELSKIEAPSYLKSAVNSRLSRTYVRNGGPVFDNKEKCVNFQENNLYSPCVSVNGSISSAADEQTPKKERKGFKKLFKKGFLK